MNVYAMGIKFPMLKCSIVKLMLAFCVLRMKLATGGVIRRNLDINLSQNRFCFLAMDELVLEKNMQQTAPSAQRIGMGRLLNHKIRTCSVCPDNYLWGVGFMINMMDYQNLIEYAAMKVSPIFISEVFVEFEDSNVTCKTTNLELPINLVDDLKTSKNQINSDISSVSSELKYSSQESKLYEQQNVVPQHKWPSAYSNNPITHTSPINSFDTVIQTSTEPRTWRRVSPDENKLRDSEKMDLWALENSPDYNWNVKALPKRNSKTSKIRRKPRALHSLNTLPFGGVYSKQKVSPDSIVKDSLPSNRVVSVTTRKNSLKPLKRPERSRVEFSYVTPNVNSNTNTRELQYSSQESTSQADEVLNEKESNLYEQQNVLLQDKWPSAYSNNQITHTSPIHSFDTVIQTSTEPRTWQRISADGNKLRDSENSPDHDWNVKALPNWNSNTSKIRRKPRALHSLKILPFGGVYSKQKVSPDSIVKDSLPSNRVVSVTTRKNSLKPLKRPERSGVEFSYVTPNVHSNTKTRELQYSSQESTSLADEVLNEKESNLYEQQNLVSQDKWPSAYSNNTITHTSPIHSFDTIIQTSTEPRTWRRVSPDENKLRDSEKMDLWALENSPDYNWNVKALPKRNSKTSKIRRKPRALHSLNTLPFGGVYSKQKVSPDSIVKDSLPSNRVVSVTTRKNSLKPLKRPERSRVEFSYVTPNVNSNTNTRELQYSSQESTSQADEVLNEKESNLYEQQNVLLQDKWPSAYSNNQITHTSPIHSFDTVIQTSTEPRTWQRISADGNKLRDSENSPDHDWNVKALPNWNSNTSKIRRKPRALHSLKILPFGGVYSKQKVSPDSIVKDSLPSNRVVSVTTRKNSLKPLKRPERSGVEFSYVTPNVHSNTKTRELQYSSQESTSLADEVLNEKESNLYEQQNLVSQDKWPSAYSNNPITHTSPIHSFDTIIQTSTEPRTWRRVSPDENKLRDSEKMDLSALENSPDYNWNVKALPKRNSKTSKIRRKPRALHSLNTLPFRGVYSKQKVSLDSIVKDSLPSNRVVSVTTRKNSLKPLKRPGRSGVEFSYVTPNVHSNTNTRELQYSSQESTSQADEVLNEMESNLYEQQNVLLQDKWPSAYSNNQITHTSPIHSFDTVIQTSTEPRTWQRISPDGNKLRDSENSPDHDWNVKALPNWNSNTSKIRRKPRALHSLKILPFGGVYSKQKVSPDSIVKDSLPSNRVVSVTTRKNSLKPLKRPERSGVEFSYVTPNVHSNTNTRELQYSSQESTSQADEVLNEKESNLYEQQNVLLQDKWPSAYSNNQITHTSPIHSFDTVIQTSTEPRTWQRISADGNKLRDSENSPDHDWNVKALPNWNSNTSKIRRKPRALHSLKILPFGGVYSKQKVSPDSIVKDSLPSNRVVSVTTRKNSLKPLKRPERSGVEFSYVTPNVHSNTNTRELQYSSQESTSQADEVLNEKESNLYEQQNVLLQDKWPSAYSNNQITHTSPIHSFDTVIQTSTEPRTWQRISADGNKLRDSENSPDHDWNVKALPNWNSNTSKIRRKPRALHSLKILPFGGVYSKQKVSPDSIVKDSLPSNRVVSVTTRKNSLKPLKRPGRSGVEFSYVTPNVHSNTNTRELQYSSQESTSQADEVLNEMESNLYEQQNLVSQDKWPSAYSNNPITHTSPIHSFDTIIQTSTEPRTWRRVSPDENKLRDSEKMDLSALENSPDYNWNVKALPKRNSKTSKIRRKPRALHSLNTLPFRGVYSKQKVSPDSIVKDSLPSNRVVSVTTRKNSLKPLKRPGRSGVEFSYVTPNVHSNTNTRELQYSSQESTSLTGEVLNDKESKLYEQQNLVSQDKWPSAYSNNPTTHTSASDMKHLKYFKPGRSHKISSNGLSNILSSFPGNTKLPHSSDVITKKSSPMSSFSQKKFGKLNSYPNNSRLGELLLGTYSIEQFDKNNKLTSMFSYNNNQRESNSALANSNTSDFISMSSKVSSREIENRNLDSKESTVERKRIPTMSGITFETTTSAFPDIEFDGTNINNPNSQVLISENERMSKKSYKSQHTTRKVRSVKSHQESTLSENISLL